MQRQSMMKMAGLIGLILMGMGGCGVWPVMTEDNGRRPQAMGKSDQVFWPWAPQPVHLHEDYGVPYRQALENQIVNPASANNLGPIPGAADSQALQHSMERYQLMFQSPPYSELKLKGGSSSSASSTGNTSTGSGVGGTQK